MEVDITPPTDTPMAAATFPVEIIVYDSDLEHPQDTRKCKAFIGFISRPGECLSYAPLDEIEPADGCVDVLIWLVTNPKNRRDRLTPLRDHTRWYIREIDRHSHTTSGLAFRRLVADQPLRDIPFRNGIGTVCVVQSDKPYMVLTVGKEKVFTSASNATSDEGILLQDYINHPLAQALSPAHWGSHPVCEYHNRMIHSKYSIATDDTQKWRDLPYDQVQDYSADWLLVLLNQRPAR
ncbi:hypothetical protein FRB97_008151 [Tulasnella sp. 331]|nr:hypothetical protein FRB97_008151 [Tulasnella sp. 331]